MWFTPTNIGGGEQYLTAILYFIFILIAIAGWKRWRRESATSKA